MFYYIILVFSIVMMVYGVRLIYVGIRDYIKEKK